jgi:hypothetical protein
VSKKMMRALVAAPAAQRNEHGVGAASGAPLQSSRGAVIVALRSAKGDRSRRIYLVAVALSGGKIA